MQAQTAFGCKHAAIPQRLCPGHLQIQSAGPYPTLRIDYGAAHDLVVGAGSDAHVPGALGAAYVIMPDFDGPASFVASMAQGRIVGHHYDEPRPWTPRIIPSVDDPIST